MRAINVRHKMAANAIDVIWTQRLVDHDRAKVGAPNTDIDHIGDFLAGMPLPFTRMDTCCKVFQTAKHFLDRRHDVFAVNLDRAAIKIAKCCMQDRAVFGDIDPITFKHPVAPAFNIGRLGKLDQGRHHIVGDQVFGVINKQVIEGRTVSFKARRIVGKGLTQIEFFGNFRAQLIEFIPACGHFISRHTTLGPFKFIHNNAVLSPTG